MLCNCRELSRCDGKAQGGPKELDVLEVLGQQQPSGGRA